MKYLRELCVLDGTSGDESALRDFILSRLGDLPYTIDNLGNIIVEKKGAAKPKNKLMLSAHMDEVGFIITHIDDNGFLHFSPVGGIEPKALVGKRVRMHALSGVIGTAPVHLSDDEEAMLKLSDLRIDIGAKDKADAEKYISTGDCGVFDSAYVEFGNDFVKSKAIDDRFGCSVLLELLEKDLPFDVTVCFVVMEEIGLKGAGCAAARVKPDIAIVFESTTANDIIGVDGAEQVCAVGAGAVVSFMDKRTVYDRALYRAAMETAAENGIKAQTKTKIAGGNDAGSIQVAGEGVRVAALSLPTRYIHSACCVASKADMRSVLALSEKLIERFGNIH